MSKLVDEKNFLESLDVPCWRCHGAGKPNWHECATCDGSGYLLSEAGLQLLRFITRHDKKLKEMIEENEKK